MKLWLKLLIVINNAAEPFVELTVHRQLCNQIDHHLKHTIRHDHFYVTTRTCDFVNYVEMRPVDDHHLSLLPAQHLKHRLQSCH